MGSTEAAQLLDTHPEAESKLYLMLLAEKVSSISTNRISVGSDEALSGKVAIACKVERRKEPWTSDVLKKNLPHPCAHVFEFSCQPLG